MAFCVNCGSPLPQGSLFCPNCGTDLRLWMQQPPATSAPQATSPVQRPEVTAPQWQQAVGQNSAQPPVFETKPKTIPGKRQATAGRLLSIFGFALSVLGMLTTFTFMTLMMTMNNIADYRSLVSHLGMLSVEALCLSVLGLVFSVRGEKKGNLKVTAGKRLGWIGIAFSAIAAVNVILFIIVFAFSGRVLSV